MTSLHPGKEDSVVRVNESKSNSESDFRFPNIVTLLPNMYIYIHTASSRTLIYPDALHIVIIDDDGLDRVKLCHSAYIYIYITDRPWIVEFVCVRAF